MYEEIFAKYSADKENLIAILHDVQNNHPQHYVSPEAINRVSEYLRIPVSHIQGVLTFYTMYSTRPRGKYIIRLCESPPCFLRGSESILAKLKQLLGVKLEGTTSDGLFTLELCACLGVCGNAPVMMINDELYGDLTEEKVVAVIKKLTGGEA
ncbi:MAG: NAD(P)H-dependent oxidoreductase subunit E [Candidatus Cloacimonetes bacterium]|nr:NAD(P)H-dependent oxidoreductase subunit E [Candidatus Cloacimonadota bacterium]